MSSDALEGHRHLLRIGSEWVEVREMGEGDPLVLVPGLAGSWRLLSPLAKRLAKKHRVILYGLRGDFSPLGSGSPATDVSDLSGDLAALIENLGLERPTVFGVSFGGAVALDLAIEHPHHVGRLVLSGIESAFRPTLGSTIARRVLERFPLPNSNRFVNQFFNLLHGGKPEPGPLADFVIDRCWETDQSVMAQRLGMLETFDVTHRAWQIDAPTLVLGGTRDVVVPVARQKALASAIPGARFEALEGAGHLGFLTHKAEVCRHVVEHVHAEKPTAF